MQPKAKELAFDSELAPWLYAFFEEKRRLGYKYNGIDVLIMSFDKFLLDKDCKNLLPEDLVLQWVEQKPHQREVYREPQKNKAHALLSKPPNKPVMKLHHLLAGTLAIIASALMNNYLIKQIQHSFAP